MTWRMFLYCIVSAWQHIYLARYMLSPIRTSVRLSVCHWISQKRLICPLWEATTAKQMKIDLQCQRRSCSPLNALSSGVWITLISHGVPKRQGAWNKAGVGKICSFLSLSLNISKTVADTASYIWAFHWHQDRWPWMTLNCISLNFQRISRDFADFGCNYTAKRMKIGQYCQRQRCKHVELEQFWHAFASRGFVSDSWAFLLT